jgi:hypothetical protein
MPRCDKFRQPSLISFLNAIAIAESLDSFLERLAAAGLLAYCIVLSDAELAMLAELHEIAACADKFRP